MCVANSAITRACVSLPTNVEPSAIEVPSPNVRPVSPVGKATPVDLASAAAAAPVAIPTGDLDLKSGTLTLSVPHDAELVLPQSLVAFSKLKRGW